MFRRCIIIKRLFPFGAQPGFESQPSCETFDDLLVENEIIKRIG